MKSEAEVKELLDLIEWRLHFPHRLDDHVLWALGGMREILLHVLGEKEKDRDDMIRGWAKVRREVEENQKNPIAKSS